MALIIDSKIQIKKICARCAANFHSLSSAGITAGEALHQLIAAGFQKTAGMSRDPLLFSETSPLPDKILPSAAGGRPKQEPNLSTSSNLSIHAFLESSTLTQLYRCQTWGSDRSRLTLRQLRSECLCPEGGGGFDGENKEMFLGDG